ncbi:(3,5-dihydroxyphenyl)acetyl-CoA 1,2-dioxygenase DpgC [Micromonospora fluostatini]|uniref:(3,5-dihydroxyphenyl)acetyl-CoA 1,2-dioxygenase DpgC n=1 Tax=Micromonospora sp. JCM 30529 TaxID=3421643 RepID=UPI003D171F09
MDVAPVLCGDFTLDRRAAESYLRRKDGQLAALPRRPDRTAHEQARAEAVHADARRFRSEFLGLHAESVYDDLTARRTTTPRLGELAHRAGVAFPGLAPTAAQMAEEAGRPQAAKEGREIDQGILFHALLSAPVAGAHLVEAMLRPTARAVGLRERYERTGRVELDAARVERRGSAGHVTITNVGCLNAEDNLHVADVETAVDLVLLDPATRVGVLRGGPMTHPRYAGRRVFSAGINLKHLRSGEISFIDFLLRRELGYLSKIVRGVAGVRPRTVQKPWLAVVDTFAIGGGAQILLTCDRVIAVRDSWISLPAAREGIVPGVANLRLTRFVGSRAARRLILGGARIRAGEPEGGFFFDDVVDEPAVDAAIDAAVADLATPAVATNRRMLNLAEEPVDGFRHYLAEYALEQAVRAYSPDVLDKVAAFH